ncbi:hypothetical protein AB4Z45_19665 [Paenibacillus sp. MCAF9]|uniref:hypothetical protein n=1 Tax=Paenibacillus sp. TAF43_2 TaxID=3233069 RepID=UPI003F94AD75
MAVKLDTMLIFARDTNFNVSYEDVSWFVYVTVSSSLFIYYNNSTITGRSPA